MLPWHVKGQGYPMSAKKVFIKCLQNWNTSNAHIALRMATKFPK